jgi:hypothetical protein
MALDRGSRLNFWVGPGVVIFFAVIAAVVAVFTNRPDLILRVSFPCVYVVGA